MFATQRAVLAAFLILSLVSVQGCLSTRYLPEKSPQSSGSAVPLQAVGAASVTVNSSISGTVGFGPATPAKTAGVNQFVNQNVSQWFQGSNGQHYTVNVNVGKIKDQRWGLFWASFFPYLATLTLFPGINEHSREVALTITDDSGQTVYSDAVDVRMREYLSVYFPTPVFIGKMGTGAMQDMFSGTLPVLKERLSAAEQQQLAAYYPIQQTTNPGEVEAFLDNNPTSFFRAKALQKLAELTSKQKDARARFANYLNKYPDFRPYLPAADGIYYIGPAGMTIADVQNKLKEGVSPAIIASLIRSNRQPYKQFSLEESQALTKLGIPDDVVAAMIEVSATAPAGNAYTQAQFAAQQQAQPAAGGLMMRVQPSTAAPQATTSAPTTVGGQVQNAAEECVKAYAAKKACEQMPSDPFGAARKVCVSQVKKKFGGAGCPLL